LLDFLIYDKIIPLSGIFATDFRRNSVSEDTSSALTSREAYLVRSLAAAGQQTFTVEDADAILEENRPTVRKILHRLCAARWIERLERGKYRLLPLEAGPEGQWAEHEFLIASALVSPYYLAYATALTYYGYSEQPLGPIWMATTRRKAPVTIDGVAYRFVTLTRHKFFGYAQIEILGQEIQIAEREKALVDALDHPQYAGGVLEGAKALWFGREELDLEKAVDYAERLRNRTAAQRLGFWLETLGLGSTALLDRLEELRTRNYGLLEPRGPQEGVRSSRWRLVVNVPERQLLEWKEH
jgi:predicted transcriptional regulator of viral defense system